MSDLKTRFLVLFFSRRSATIRPYLHPCASLLLSSIRCATKGDANESGTASKRAVAWYRLFRLGTSWSKLISCSFSFSAPPFDCYSIHSVFYSLLLAHRRDLVRYDALTRWPCSPWSRKTKSKTTKSTKKGERRRGRPSERGQRRPCCCCCCCDAAAAGQGGAASPRGGRWRTALLLFFLSFFLRKEKRKKKDKAEGGKEKKLLPHTLLLLSRRRRRSPSRVHRPSKKTQKNMVSQQLCPSPLLPRALLPASSLEPLEAEERVLCSFERVRVAAGGADDDAAAAETNAQAAVGTLHVTSRYADRFCLF